MIPGADHLPSSWATMTTDNFLHIYKQATKEEGKYIKEQIVGTKNRE